MSSNKSLLNSLPEIYKEKISALSTESLEIILQDRNKAIEYAKKGLMQTEPEKDTDAYIELIADSMQILAKIVLDERGLSA